MACTKKLFLVKVRMSVVKILDIYKPNDIFKADETGFFKCLPDKTLAFKGDKCFGGKHSKERATVTVGANMTGTEKLPLLVIGKSKNPRCFKRVKSLEVEYKCNKKAWMTSDIFCECILKLDKRMTNERRKIVLIVDNCPAHPCRILSKLNNNGPGHYKKSENALPKANFI